MGTNVYALKKNLYTNGLYQSYEKAIKKAIKECNDVKLEQITIELLKETEENKIHIGKRSCGWKFLFNHNNWKYYDFSRESINNFLKSCYKIINEYDEEISLEVFWKEYVDDFKCGMNGEQYCNYELENAKAKEKGELKDKFNLYMSVNQAIKYYEDSKKHNWYEAQICTFGNKEQKIPYEKLDYRFSYSTEFC